MQIDLIALDDLEKDNKTYIKGISLVGSVKIDYTTGKHMSFIVRGEESSHNVMYFVEKTAFTFPTFERTIFLFPMTNPL